jgi:hypothetical protein
MRKRNWPAALLAGMLLLALLAGLLYFAGLDSPGTYPEMSSFNPEPSGAKLLFDTMSGVGKFSVTRNYLPLSQWRPANTSVVFLGIPADTLNIADKDFFSELERLSQPNNRLILFITKDKLQAKFNPKKPPVLGGRWGVELYDTGKRIILKHDSSWQGVVGVERAWEKRFPNGGTVVLALYSEQFSNESLAKDDAPLNLFLPLMGANTSVAFEETHLGIEETGSIAGLARRYRLQGLMAGLLLLAALFIWNRSVSFPPPTRFDNARETQVVGAAASGVFAGLIARHLTPRALMEACVTEWNRAKPQQRINTELQSKVDAVTTYRQLQEGLRAKRTN